MKRRLSLSFLSVLVLAITLSVIAIGCKKEIELVENSDPIPSEANYFVCGNDSLQISIVVVMRSAYKGDVMDWSFKFSDSQILKLYTTKDLMQNGTWNFTTEAVAYNGGEGIFGVYMEGFEEEALTQGSIEVKLINGQPEFTLRGITKSGRNVKMHYYGENHDLTHPIGNGQLQFGSEIKQLDIAYSQLYYDLYEYAFTDTVSGFGVTFYSTQELQSGTIPITDNMSAVEQGEALNLYLYIEDGTTSLIGDVTNGSATCTIVGDRIEITFNGELEGFSINGHYQGRMERLGSSILKCNHK